MIDIIIPTYKNKQGLQRTLQSINTDLLDKFTITVIDDCSNIDYQDIKINFPFINFYSLSKNVGPGMVRQFGINHTKEPYILFIDTEDVFYNFNIQIQMIKQILNHSQIYIFSWITLVENKGNNKDTHANVHGRIFKRTFLKEYNITFSEKGSYANQDVGFIRLCRFILRYKNMQKKYLYIKKPLIIYTLNQDSITRTNNNGFRYSLQNIGLAYNEEHVISILEQNNFPSKQIQNEVDIIINSLYKNFYKTLQERPNYLENSWQGAKYFYSNIYFKYQNTKGPKFEQAYLKLIKQRQKQSDWTKNIPINIYRFLQALKKQENIPTYYLTFTQNHDIINK